MAVKKLILPKNNDILIPRSVADKLFQCADGRVALLYLYILSCNGDFDDQAAASCLSMTRDDIGAALDILIRVGLTEHTSAPQALERPDTIPDYSQEDVASALSNDVSFQYLLEYTQNKLGKILSTVDTQTLLGIYSWMGIPVDVICLLITSSIDETEKKYGPGRRPTMRNIERHARLWLNLGIMSQEQAESYLQEQERRGTRIAQITRMLHLGGRALSPTENRYLSSWIDSGFSDELILKAYDITVVKTGGLKWKYMDTILKNWQSKGIETIADVDHGDLSPKRESTREVREDSCHELESMRRLREINRMRRSEEE